MWSDTSYSILFCVPNVSFGIRKWNAGWIVGLILCSCTVHIVLKRLLFCQSNKTSILMPRLSVHTLSKPTKLQQPSRITTVTDGRIAQQLRQLYWEPLRTNCTIMYVIQKCRIMTLRSLFWYIFITPMIGPNSFFSHERWPLRSGHISEHLQWCQIYTLFVCPDIMMIHQYLKKQSVICFSRIGVRGFDG